MMNQVNKWGATPPRLLLEGIEERYSNVPAPMWDLALQVFKVDLDSESKWSLSIPMVDMNRQMKSSSD